MNTGESVEFEQYATAVQYEWDKLIVLKRASDSFWRCAEAPQLTVTLMASPFFEDGVDFRLTWPVAKRKMMSLRWPYGWWEAFKMRWFPQWARERWPVRYQMIDLHELLAVRRESEHIQSPLAYHIVRKQGIPQDDA